MQRLSLATIVALILFGSGCSTFSSSSANSSQLVAADNAKVLEVEATGQPHDYTFTVTVRSPDTGCDRYADWWEVITPDGELLYRRILLHSHVDEQPFTRTGGTVAIAPQQEVIIRVHMSVDGYSPQAQQGTINSGFSEVTLPPDFATTLADVEPLPTGCSF